MNYWRAAAIVAIENVKLEEMKIGDVGYMRKFIQGYQRLKIREIKKDKIYVDVYFKTYNNWRSLKTPLKPYDIYKYS